MMLASIYGRFGKEPRNIETAKTAMCVSSMAVELIDKNGDSTTRWFGLVAFGKVADILVKHSKGDLIAAGGGVQANSWMSKDGQAKTEFQLVADSIVSARAAKPSTKRKSRSPEQSSTETELTDSHNGGAPFDDKIPF